MEIIATHRFSNRLAQAAKNGYFISFRVLSQNDVNLFKNNNIKRIVLPLLSPEQTEDFLKCFDIFWDEVIRDKSKEHVFWRTAVSSKMQPWEGSIGYFCLLLFTLSKMDISGKVLIFVNSLEMKKAVLNWANIKKWKVNLASYWENDVLLKSRDVLFRIGYSFRMLVYCLDKKTLSLGVRLPQANVRDDQAQVLITSMMYSSSVNEDKYRDPFFNDLHTYIERKRHGVTYLCDMLNIYARKDIQKASQCKDAQILPLYLSLGYADIVMSFFKLGIRKTKFSGCSFKGCDFSALVFWEACFLDSFNMTAELFFIATRKILENKRYQRVITKFEGNVNERACIQAARDRGVQQIIGYVHTVMYDYNLKIRLTSRESSLKPCPDKYICIGPYSKEHFLRIGHGYEEGIVKTGYMIKKVPRFIHGDHSGEKHILVALDGLGIENTAGILDWLFVAAKVVKKKTFMVRFHPNIPSGETLKQCINDIPDNVFVSNNSLERDLAACECVLYRHSQLGIEALLNRIPVVYMNVNSPLSGDPLFGLDVWKYSVSNASEFLQVFDKIAQEGREKKEHEYEIVQDFLKNYFKIPPVDPSEDFMR